MIERLTAAGHWQPGDPDILVVVDAGYDVLRLAHVLADLPIIEGTVIRIEVTRLPSAAGIGRRGHCGGQPAPQVRPRRGAGGVDAVQVSLADLLEGAQGGDVEATGPNTSAWARKASMSTMSTPPPAIVQAMSVSTRPRSWNGRNPGRARIADIAWVRPVRSAIIRNAATQIMVTTPSSSALTGRSATIRHADARRKCLPARDDD